MDEQGWVEKVDKEEEDEEEDEEDEEEKAEEANGAEMEMGMEVVEKGTDEEMGEAVEGMQVEE